MGLGIPGIHRSCEQVTILGKSLNQIKPITENEDRKARSQRFASDELQQLLARPRLIIHFHVDQI